MNKGLLAILLFFTMHSTMNAQEILPMDTSLVNFVLSNLVGYKQDVSNIQGQFTNSSIGLFFDYEDTELGLNEGIILSTGRVIDAVGPNSKDGVGINLGLGGDSTLSQLVTGVSLYDATSIEFDFVPFTNVISFDYVFASEEYPEYVNSAFNDVFGFFVSGPGIEGEVNIALLPDSLVVAINNVNHLTNTQWFRGNTNSTGETDMEHIEYDGFTVPLTAAIDIRPFETYHVKLVIADVYDGGWDSAIFLKANSFESEPLVFDFDFTEGNYSKVLKEDSLALMITAKLPVAAKQDIVYHFAYSGDAVLGEDFVGPETFTFEQGDTVASFKIQALKDDIVEGTETFMMIIQETKDTLTIDIEDNTMVLGTESLVDGEVLLFPNPATVSFGLPLDLDVERVDLYSLAGKKVKSFTDNFQQMDISHLSQGLFSVYVITAEGVMVQKLKKE